MIISRSLEKSDKMGVMLRYSKHARSGLYDMLSTRAWAFTHVALRVPQGDMPPRVQNEIVIGDEIASFLAMTKSYN